MDISKGIKKYFKYLWLLTLILNISNLQIAFAAENRGKQHQIQLNPVDEFNLNSRTINRNLPESGEWKILSKPRDANIRLEKINANESSVKFVNHTTGNYRFQFQSSPDKIDTVEIFYGLKKRFSTNTAFFNSPAIAPDGSIYLSSERTPGFGLIWHFSADGESSSFVLDTYDENDIRVFVDVPLLTPEGKLFGLMTNMPDDPGFNRYWLATPDGKVRSCKAYPLGYYSVPALRDDGIFYGIFFGKLDFRDKGIGALLASKIEILCTQGNSFAYDWLFNLDLKGFEQYNKTIISNDGTIYTSIDSFFYAVNADSTLKWQYSLTSEITTVPAVDAEGTIYFGAADHQMYAITNDGSLKWTFPAEREIHTSPAIGVDGTIYFGSSDWYLYALNADGSLRWKTLTAGPILSSPAIARDGSIYVGSDDRRLYAFSPAGEILWYFETEFQLRNSPAIAEDGTIVFCDGNMHRVWTASNYPDYEANGNLYLVATQNGGLARSPWPKYRHDNRNTSCAMNQFTVVERPKAKENIADVKRLTNFPNPFNSVTTICFQIPEHRPPGDLKLLIYNVLGEEVQRFDLNVSLKKEIQWDGTNHHHQMVASGTYLAVLTDGNWRKTLKLLYLR